jgi:steroid delta-isomerase-like uncharacterized protein
VSGCARRDWGDDCAFVADPSGNVLVLAHGEPAVDETEWLRVVALRWLKLWQGGDIADFDAIHAPSFIDHAPNGRPPDRAGFQTGLRSLYAAFPDFDLVVEDLVVDAGQQKVAVRWSATGTHAGAFLGVEPTGRTIIFRGVEIVRIERDRIIERWGEWDGLDVVHKLARAAKPRSD